MESIIYRARVWVCTCRNGFSTLVGPSGADGDGDQMYSLTKTVFLLLAVG